MGVKYAICDHCGRKIPMGSEVWEHCGWLSGVYCSAECYANSWGGRCILNESFANANGCKIWDDEQRKKDLSKKMEELNEKLAKAKFELETLQ